MKYSRTIITITLLTFVLQSCKKDDTDNSTGDNWHNLATVQGGLPCRIQFPTESIGYMCGSDGGFVAKTINGGITWNQLADPEGTGVSSMYALCFINKDTGYVGIDGTAGRIYKTINGGQTWTVSCPTAIGAEGVTFVNDIYFTDAMHGVAATRYGRIVYTADGGDTWVFAGTDNYFNLVDYYGISFIDNNTGFIAGTLSTVMKTTDGGANWVTLNNYNINTTENILGSEQLYDVQAFDANNFILSSRTGGIFRTNNGGSTWSKISDVYCARMGFDSGTHGFIAGTSDNNPFVNFYETTDAGLTWQNITIENHTIIFRDFVMVKPGLGYGISDHSAYQYRKD